jgi:hypothetical protein
MRSMAQDAFGRALSLAVPNTSVPCSSLFELAVDVVRRGRFDAGEARRLLAMDASADPFREAMDELEEALNRTIRSGRDRQAVWDLCTRVAGAARDSVSAPVQAPHQPRAHDDRPCSPRPSEFSSPRAKEDPDRQANRHRPLQGSAQRSKASPATWSSRSTASSTTPCLSALLAQ